MPSPEFPSVGRHPQATPAVPPKLASGQDPACLTDLLANLWQRSLPEITVRLSVLDRAATAAMHGALTVDLRREAASVAHKLAGSLGMYGHSLASDFARNLEQMLETDGQIDPVHLRQHTLHLRQAIPLDRV